jgi:hypothetical protein
MTAHPGRSIRERARAWFVMPSDKSGAAAPATSDRAAPPAPPSPTPTTEPHHLPPGGREITTAAVLGRPEEAEPVAAALALALSRRVRARAAIVTVLSGTPTAGATPGAGAFPACTNVPGLGGAPAAEAAPGAGGTPAARRLSARLGAHGLAAHPRGRLVWVRPSAHAAQVAVRRVAAMGAPVVVAVTAPRTAALDELIADQDLTLVVTADPEGPLGRLALAAQPETRVLVAPPLPRGPARSLARGGLRPARSMRELLTTAAEARS